MKIAVIGSGAVGCFYGARLARCGHEVHFLMRRDLDAVRCNGLRIESVHGSFHLREVHAHGDAREIGTADLVLCALKATAMSAAESMIRPCVGPKTRIVAMMNGLGIEEQFGTWFKPSQVFGGMAFVCINRGEPGVVHHYDHGRVAFGHLLDDLAAAGEVARLFAEAGFESDVRPSLRQARWEKLMWNIPFSTLAVTVGGATTQEILNDPGLTAMARQLIVETGQAGNADGCHIDIEGMLNKMMANTATMGRYRPSMLVDYENKLPLEVEAILGEPVRRARAVNCPVPTIEAQYRLAAFLDKLNRGEIKNPNA
jgi:2-dehydropantoate 2-reductase